MNRENVDAISMAGQGVAAEASDMPLRYFMRSMVGGMFLFIGVFLSIMTTALLQDFHAGVAKIGGAFVFPIGLALIVLLGGQLYTGAAFTLPVAVLEKKQAWERCCVCWHSVWLGI